MAKVTAQDRKKTGMKGGSKKGKYPVATKAQRDSAIKLRGKGKGTTPSGVLSHVANAARKSGDTATLKKVAEARKKDRKKKKK